LQPQLKELQKEHDAFLKKEKKKKGDGQAALAAFTDTSAPNLSSIVVQVKNGARTLLLTGDARGDFILEGLKAAKLLKANKPYVVDLLKVPHHGSDRNMTQEFFEQVHATHYVFSGDGEHGNPERETLQMLFEARKNVASLGNEPFTIWLTYPIDDIDVKREEDWEKELAKGRKSRAWDPVKDSLRTFFDHAGDFDLPHTLNDDKDVRITL
jgi:beta-lactamase superfamily II metal-dependent hydrolase